MRTAEQWLQIISTTDQDHPCDCICKRCKNGKETFLVEEDFDQVIQDAYNQAIEDAAEVCIKYKDTGDLHPPINTRNQILSLRKPTTTTK